MIKFEILGKVQAKQRPRFGKGFTYTPQETVNYENYVKMCYKQASKEYFEQGVALNVKIVVYYDIPKSFSKKKKEDVFYMRVRPTIKPDCDNIAKGICDALNGIAWHDDSQIVELTIVKSYGEQAKVIVEIEGITQ